MVGLVWSHFGPCWAALGVSLGNQGPLVVVMAHPWAHGGSMNVNKSSQTQKCTTTLVKTIALEASRGR
jgi:hypothetical protein